MKWVWHTCEDTWFELGVTHCGSVRSFDDIPNDSRNQFLPLTELLFFYSLWKEKFNYCIVRKNKANLWTKMTILIIAKLITAAWWNQSMNKATTALDFLSKIHLHDNKRKNLKTWISSSQIPTLNICEISFCLPMN